MHEDPSVESMDVGGGIRSPRSVLTFDSSHLSRGRLALLIHRGEYCRCGSALVWTLAEGVLSGRPEH